MKTMTSKVEDDVPVSESTRLLWNDEVTAVTVTPTVGTTEAESDTNDESTNNSDEEKKNLSRTVVALSFSLLVQSYLLVSVFPYSGFLAMHLIPGLNEETAGSYAGLIASSFMAGRTFSSFEWGKAADRYGRVFVIKMSLLLSSAFSILFGIAPTFKTALILRFLLGLCNGLIGPVKTLVSEYAGGDQKKETQMMAIVLGMWGYGFLINPAISGYLSDPVKQYPDAEFVRILSPMLQEFPFFLPNLVGCFFCLIGYVLIHNFVDETLPEGKRQQFKLLPRILPCMTKDHTIIRNVSSWGLFKHLHNSRGEISEDNLNTVVLSPSHDKDGRRIIVEKDGEEETATISSLIKRKGTRQHLLVYWGYSFLIVTLDEVFPLFCISKTSGLGVSEKIIGNILSGTGLLYICVQYFLLTGLVERYGFYTSLRIATMLSVPLGCFIPVSLITNKGAPDGTLALMSLVFLSVVYAVIRTFSSVVFSTITMTTNRTVPKHQRASMNGLSMLGGSLAKAIGPLFGGMLFSTSVNHVTPPIGSVVVYSIVALLGICLAVQAYFLREYDEQENEKESRKTMEKENGKVDLETEEEAPPTF
jgi:MFS family permease